MRICFFFKKWQLFNVRQEEEEEDKEEEEEDEEKNTSRDTLIVGDCNTPLSTMVESSRQKHKKY